MIQFWLPILLASTLAVGLGGYFRGRSDVQEKWNAEKALYMAAAAKAEGELKERERVWGNAVKVAGEKWSENAKLTDKWAADRITRLRAEYATRDRVREATATVAPECRRAGEPSAADLLRAAEGLVGIASDADKDRAALKACVAAWPR